MLHRPVGDRKLGYVQCCRMFDEAGPNVFLTIRQVERDVNVLTSLPLYSTRSVATHDLINIPCRALLETLTCPSWYTLLLARVVYVASEVTRTSKVSNEIPHALCGALQFVCGTCGRFKDQRLLKSISSLRDAHLRKLYAAFSISVKGIFVHHGIP